MVVFKPRYPAESAGRRMIKNVPTALPEESIADIRKRLFEKAGDFETLNYIYILNKKGELTGALSLKDVFQKAENVKIKDLMAKEVVRVRPSTDQERVAILALKYNLKAIPVVNKGNIFLGVVPSDTILEILHTEDVEDILRFAGIAKHDNFSSKIFHASPGVLTKLRLPWLVLGLFGGILMAQIVTFFEEPLEKHFILAAFIPLIVYMADAVGTQTETLFIRSLVYRVDIKKYFLREIKISLSIALALGLLLALVSYLWFKLFQAELEIGAGIGIILGISLFFTIVTAFLFGLLVPYFFMKLKKDPAVVSGPVGTIIRDILSLIIYFAIATGLLHLF